MIKYYDNEAAYAADAKSQSESQISLIGSNKAVKFDGANVVVGAKSAKTGAVVFLDAIGALHFVNVDSFTSSFPGTGNTIVGVVAIGVDHPDYRGKLAIVNKSNASKQWSAIYSFKLTGYTLDGTDRTGTLTVRDSSAWGTGVDYVIPYNCDNVADFVTTLNAYFKSTSPFTTQNWRADADDQGNVTLSFLFQDYRQASNSGKSGFALTANLLPGIAASSSMLRYNGERSGEGSISNWDRALAYYRNDNGSSAYQGGRTSNQTSIKQAYPINLPTWLGTSTQNPGDFCAALRAIYGEGEAGWLKFMKTCLPVRPTAYGPMGDKATYGDGLKNTYLMAGIKFTKQDDSQIVAFPAADYCASVVYNHELLKKGAWQLPDVDTLCAVLKTVKYNTTNNRNADPVNRALNAIGGSAISNGSYIWSSSRYYAVNAWYSGGSYGYLVSSVMCFSYQAVPVALLDVSEANI